MSTDDLEFIKLANGFLVNLMYITYVTPDSNGSYAVHIVGIEAPVGLVGGKDAQRLKTLMVQKC